ncbi:NF038120 family PEP-CTERM protein [Massilia sp. CMS3.1]|uniref:NF038120 family PEP-CTERM protein n=1 Tax=Massilia sp. CMS3.1 TaxID=3373083 RepID=UPI003EE8103A
MIRSITPAVQNTSGAMKKLLCVSVLGATGLLAGSAQAGVIDFEGYFGPATHNEFISQSGYNIGFFSNVPGAVAGEDFVGSFLDGTDAESCTGMACPVNNPGTYYAALNDSYVDITASTLRARFSINSFDAGFIGGSPVLTSYPAVSGLLRVQGFMANGSSVSETYQLAGPSASGFNFGRFNTSAAFSSLQFTEAIFFGFTCNTAGNCSAFSTNRGQFGIDNINLTEIPEPASFALFGLGMAGVAFARRRKSSKSL